MDRDTVTNQLIIESQAHRKDPGSLRLQKSLRVQQEYLHPIGNKLPYRNNKYTQGSPHTPLLCISDSGSVER